jgi:excinuclease ABC subunit C
MIGSEYFAARRQECHPDAIAGVPNGPAVFLVWAGEGAPYLARTAVLRRRLLRLFGSPGKPSRFLNLTGIARGIEYWLTGSRLESSLLHYLLARKHYPDTYAKMVKLRMPAYVKLTLGNRFPRTLVTTRIAGRGLFYGPFRTRAAADSFAAQSLDLFQIRRCEENLEPRPDHPGCMYGEMNMCLRPCQGAVTDEEYASEVARVQHFLKSGGRSLAEAITAARDRSSEELNFEEAARQHKRLERVQGVLVLRDELARDVGTLSGLAVAPSATKEAVTLFFLLQGQWTEPVEFPLAAPGSGIVSMDHRLREIATSMQPPRTTAVERQEHLALLTRWFHSNWRDGEWLGFESIERLPYRRAVNAVARIARAG